MKNAHDDRWIFLARKISLFVSFVLIIDVCLIGPLVAFVASASAAPPPESARRGYWVDPDTHLTWAAEDNAYDVNWDQAKKYCQHLTTGGFQWTLPTIEQLEKIYSVSKNKFGQPVKGNIKLTSNYQWSATKNGSDQAWFFPFNSLGKRRSMLIDVDIRNVRALCVRRSGD